MFEPSLCNRSYRNLLVDQCQQLKTCLNQAFVIEVIETLVAIEKDGKDLV